MEKLKWNSMMEPKEHQNTCKLIHTNWNWTKSETCRKLKFVCFYLQNYFLMTQFRIFKGGPSSECVYVFEICVYYVIRDCFWKYVPIGREARLLGLQSAQDGSHHISWKNRLNGSKIFNLQRLFFHEIFNVHFSRINFLKLKYKTFQ